MKTPNAQIKHPDELLEEIHRLDNKAVKYNRSLAVKITGAVGTMAMAYVFALIALISLPAAISSGSVIIIVGWVAQTFLQLVLLSIIIVGQNIQAAHQQAKADVDHHNLQLLLKIQEEQLEILNELKGEK
jgi:cobalamin biosynthesis protein CobD/CbiB